MLAGLDIFSVDTDFRLGDMVYINSQNYFFDLGYTQNNYFDKSKFSGIVIQVPENTSSGKYLCLATLVGVLVDGEINWYMPNELFKIRTRALNKDP